MDVWECDLVDVRALGKFNDSYVYILSAIDVFSKFSRTLDISGVVPSGCEQIRAKNF